MTGWCGYGYVRYFALGVDTTLFTTNLMVSKSAVGVPALPSYVIQSPPTPFFFALNIV